MKIKQLLLFVFFISFPFANYSQQWHQYSDSIIANVNKRNYSKAEQFIVLADAEIGQSKIVKDTMYADYLYSKGAFNYFQSQNSLEFFNEAISIWEVSKKVNYFKVMKNHYFMGKSYFSEQKYELAIESFEKCYEINKKHKLKENRNFTDAVYSLAALYDDKGNVNKASKYADEYISQTQQKAYENFDFNYAKAYQFKNDIAGQEKVLLAFFNNYSQNKQLNNPLLLFGINYELFKYYDKNNRIRETIKYGETAYEIYQNANLNSKEELKLIILSLIVKYGEIGDSINHDKYKKLSFSLFPDDETEDYFAELERLIKEGDFKNFKIKFDQYEGVLIAQRNYNELLQIYSFSQQLFERNILFKKEDVEVKLDLINKNKSSLSKENGIF